MNYDELDDIFGKFIDELNQNGWNGTFYHYVLVFHTDLESGSESELLKLENGFNMQLNNPAKDCEEEPCLTYWFDNNDVIEIDSLEQLLMVFQLSE